MGLFVVTPNLLPAMCEGLNVAEEFVERESVRPINCVQSIIP